MSVRVWSTTIDYTAQVEQCSRLSCMMSSSSSSMSRIDLFITLVLFMYQVRYYLLG